MTTGASVKQGNIKITLSIPQDIYKLLVEQEKKHGDQGRIVAQLIKKEFGTCTTEVKS